MKLTRTVGVLLTLLAASCAPPPPVVAATRRVRITEPAPDAVLSETYPGPSSPHDAVQIALFDAINHDRAVRGLAPVLWDAAAARVANVFCAAQVAEHTQGHFLRDGVPPYARTGLAGVFGYQSENSASWTSSGDRFPESARELALSAHRSMLEEKPPNDGHRRAILDPEATHVGVGWSSGAGRFQMSQEFLARHLQSLTFRTSPDGRAVRVDASVLSPLHIRFVTFAREPLPAHLSAAEASARTSYRYPTPMEAYVPEGQIALQVVGAVTRDRIRLGRDRDFSFLFAPDEPGLWTLVFWVGRAGEEQARPAGSATIRVES